MLEYVRVRYAHGRQQVDTWILGQLSAGEM